jgi:hypothetical protein
MGSTDSEVAMLSADTTITYLNGPNTGFPQYAERDDMIAGYASGATPSLMADNTGNPFSTTTGIATGVSDIDGNPTSLYSVDISRLRSARTPRNQNLITCYLIHVIRT